MRFIPAFLAILMIFPAYAAPLPPVVIELFTSKYCPNCPAAEHQMAKLAETDPEVIVVQQHVDYWDRGESRDPFSLADATQRQYDYSNTLGRRPGEVFTPQPILDGASMVMPPLGFKLPDALAKAKSTNAKMWLKAEKTVSGGLKVELPAGTMGTDVWVLAVEPIDSKPNLLRVRGIAQADVTVTEGTSTATLGTLPTGGTKWLVLAQTTGPGPLVGMAFIN